LQGHPWFVPALLLILVGAFTKSAQFPFHFWLPAAMEAPSPVSAYLHSATMVKAGVYLLARFAPVFAGQELWYVLVCTTGALTMLVGAWNALGSSDLKQVLAHLTVSALGSFTLLCGIGTAAAIAALLVGVTAHALYKGSLFLIAGVIEHVTGTRDLQRLGGLRRGMPWTAAAAAMAAASLAGLPPLGGFVAKEALLDMALLAPRGAAPLAAATVIGAALSFAAALRVTYYPFFRRTAAQPAREPAGAMLWVPAVLAIAGPIMGLLPLGVHVGPPVALLSAVAVAGGAVCAWSFRHPSSWTAHPRVLPRVYERGLDALFRIASWQTRMLQRGSLPYYVATVCGAVFLLVGVAVWRSGTWSEIAVGQGVRLHEAALIGAGLLAAIAAARAPSYAPALLALSMVGIAVAALFALYGAPDLAMTQIAVDTMTVLLLFATLNRLPAFDRLSDRVHRRRHAALAATAGFLMTVLILVAAADPTTTPLARYFVESSHGLAGGRNVVNVILTDFRSLDTLGEVAVLAVAGLGVWSLLRLRPAGGE
jgi:multicomponent Na+:H+ antiporter subunit A